jgi:hypothetical protein
MRTVQARAGPVKVQRQSVFGASLKQRTVLLVRGSRGCTRAVRGAPGCCYSSRFKYRPV